MFYTKKIQNLIKEKYKDYIQKYSHKKFDDAVKELGRDKAIKIDNFFRDIKSANEYNKPFYRIMLPEYSSCNDSRYKSEYVLNPSYCKERISLCRAYQIIQKDLVNLFEYIEPCDDNKATYSHRTFELLIRAAIEFEANCKGILKANGYPKKLEKMNITDYAKINEITQLSSYKVILNLWHPQPLEIQPFIEWENGHSLSCYQSYNQVKHNRDKHFKESSLENTLKAIAGLFCILYAQFDIHCANPYRPVKIYKEDKEEEDIFHYSYDKKDNIISLDGIIFDLEEPDILASYYLDSCYYYDLGDENIESFYQFPFHDSQINSIIESYNIEN